MQIKILYIFLIYAIISPEEPCIIFSNLIGLKIKNFMNFQLQNNLDIFVILTKLRKVFTFILYSKARSKKLF